MEFGVLGGETGPAGLKGIEPGMRALADFSDIDAAEGRGAAVEAAETACEQRDRSDAIAATQMMECRGYLHERLEEALLRLAQGEPYRFPVLVGLEELLCAIAVETLGERAGGPVEVSGHMRMGHG